MEYRAAALVLLVLCATIFPFTEGVIPNCCLTTSKHISNKLLRKVTRYYIQTDTGACETKALVLRVGKKRYCFDPHLEKRVMKNIKKNIRRERHHKEMKKRDE